MKVRSGIPDYRRKGEVEDTVSTHMSDVPAVEGPDGITQVIRPAAVVPELAARKILIALAAQDVRNGGVWRSQPNLWSLFDSPWASPVDPGAAKLLGTIYLAYGTPTKYEITIYRVQVTRFATDSDWTVEMITDEALAYGNLCLSECPRAELADPPAPFRF